MYKAYSKRVTVLKNKQTQADGEIKRLTELRQTLIEKNLQGIYSDDIFKEQNAIIEEKLTKAYMSKDDSLLQKYDINKITVFMKKHLEDLSVTYLNSDIHQAKVFLGSIFPSNLTWDKNTTLNPTISPLYQAIQHAEKLDFAFGDPTGSRTPLTRMKT